MSAPAAQDLKVRKAAPKKRKKAAVEPVTPELLAGLPLFNLLDDALRARIAARCENVDLARGEHLFQGAPLPDDDSPVFVLTFGDVSVHRSTADGEAVVNYLSVGDPYVQKVFVGEGVRAMRLTAMCPVKAIKLAYRDANYLLKKIPAFRDAFSGRLRALTERQRSRFDDAFQRDIARFLVEQRLTFAGRVKLKRMDICIECDGCYDACKARHGTDRLGPSEVKYGLTEIPQNCHNCVVPECIDKCKFGHITKHAETGEIVIDDNCTGCTMCSKGCSFGSIRMHPVSALDLAKYFPNRSPDAKGKNIAQKCDNCTGYADQACISACPTGAMFQVDGAHLFDHWQQFAVHHAPGFDAVESPEGTPRRWRTFWVAFTVLNTLLLTWECFGRLYWPKLTFGHLAFALGWAETGIDPTAPFKTGDFFSHGMGYFGSALMLSTQLYRLRKWTGGTQAWMEAHIWTGILGGVYGFYHTAFVFTEPIAISTFVTMMIAILTGVVGRYLVFLVPRSGAGHQLALGDLDANIKRINREVEERFVDVKAGHTALIKVEELTRAAAAGASMDGLLRAQGGEAPAEEKRPFLRSLLDLFGEDRTARQTIDAMAARLGNSVREGKAREVAALLKEKARLERSVKRHAFLARILKRYRVVHVTSSYIMFGALLLHVIFALMYHVGN
ncbi:MAG: hypothetical protein KC620_05850 [Myxococcales bacterium]|nr:hypothetical protein [Myxococcales bacterium]